MRQAPRRFPRDVVHFFGDTSEVRHVRSEMATDSLLASRRVKSGWPAIVSALHSFWSRGAGVERVGYVVRTLLLISGIIHVVVLEASGASWEGPLSLRKPATFGLSFGLTAIAVVWVASFLTLSERARTRMLGAFAAACFVETALVSLQAWRGVPSHFNLETTFDGLVARALAVGGATLVALIIALTIVAFRDNPTVPVSLLTAIRIGLVTLIGGAVVGALMIARGMLLVFSGNPQAAYATGGFLKSTHALTLHAILVLPALAWLASFSAWSEPGRRQVTLLGVAGYLLLTGVITLSNVAGLSLTSVPIWTGA